jgi:hypothetical protein
MRRAQTYVIALLGTLCVQSCTRERATEQQCHAIFDRIVEIELEEMGFRDVALAARHKAEMRARHQSAVRSCVGRFISSRAMPCVATANTTEELSHKCLH